MDHLKWTQWIEGIAVIIFGVCIASTMLSTNKKLDSVAMYSFSQVIPDQNALSNALNDNKLTTPAAIAAAARVAIDPKCTLTFRKSASSNQVKQASPVCECLYSVIRKVETSLQPGLSDPATKAFTACFKTQTFVPQNVHGFNVDNAEQTIDTSRFKFVSRTGAVWILLLSIVFHLVYNSIEFDQETHQYSNLMTNLLQRIILILCVAAQLLIPMTASNGDGSQTSKLIVFYLMLIIPAFVEGLFIDYFLSWMYDYKRRTSFIHPYVFQTTFLALMTMALIENGVFEYHILLSHYFTGHALTLAYASILLFLHYGCRKDNSDENSLENMDYNTIYGYFLVVGVSILVLLSGVIPYYPINGAPNLVWFMPWLFAGVAFAIPIFVEHILDGTDANKTSGTRLARLAHIGYQAYLAIIVAALLYYGLRVWHLNFNDKILTYKISPSDTLNFGLHTRTSNPLLYLI